MRILPTSAIPKSCMDPGAIHPRGVNKLTQNNNDPRVLLHPKRPKQKYPDKNGGRSVCIFIFASSEVTQVGLVHCEPTTLTPKHHCNIQARRDGGIALWLLIPWRSRVETTFLYISQPVPPASQEESLRRVMKRVD